MKFRDSENTNQGFCHSNCFWKRKCALLKMCQPLELFSSYIFFCISCFTHTTLQFNSASISTDLHTYSVQYNHEMCVWKENMSNFTDFHFSIFWMNSISSKGSTIQTHMCNHLYTSFVRKIMTNSYYLNTWMRAWVRPYRMWIIQNILQRSITYIT